MNYNCFMADDNFYFNLLNMKPELRDANLDLLSKATTHGKRLKDDRLPFLLESPIFMERVIDARRKLGLKNEKPIYADISSSTIQRLMRVPTREELIELELIPYNAEEAVKSQELIESLRKALETEKDSKAIKSINRDIEEMTEGATGYLGYHDDESRKYLYRDNIIKQIISESSLDESWYVIVENIVLNGRYPDEAYMVHVPIGVTIEDTAPNGDAIIRVAKGCTKQEYMEAWKSISRFTGKPRKMPKTSSNIVRDLGIVKDMNAGMTPRQAAVKYFPGRAVTLDLINHIHKIYDRKSVK